MRGRTEQPAPVQVKVLPPSPISKKLNMNKNTKRRHDAARAELVLAHQSGRRDCSQRVSTEKGMVQEVLHNTGPDGKRASITVYKPAPGAKRVYARTFKAAKTDL